MKDYECLFGIEIESTFNSTLDSIKIGDYHRGTKTHQFSNYYVAERDGSLSGTNKYPHSAEFVSVPFLYSDRLKPILAFKEKTIKVSKLEKLKEVFDFNKTTSCHVNVSMTKKSKGDMLCLESNRGEVLIEDRAFVSLPSFITYSFLKDIRTKVYNKIRDKWGESVADKWIKNYNRPQYARINEKLVYKEKYNELFIRPNNARLEFRGFHLQEITTWEEFEWYLNMFFEVINETLVNEMKKTTKKFSEEENLEFKFNIKYKKLCNIEKEL